MLASDMEALIDEQVQAAEESGERDNGNVDDATGYVFDLGNGESWYTNSVEFVNEDTGESWKLVESKRVDAIPSEASGKDSALSVHYDAIYDEVTIAYSDERHRWALCADADTLRSMLEDRGYYGCVHGTDGIEILPDFENIDWSEFALGFNAGSISERLSEAPGDIRYAVASIVADFLPFVGTGKSVYELVMGIDPITGENVGRVWAAAGLGASMIPGGKGALKGVKIWSSTTKRSSVKNAYKHFQKHSSEFPEFRNAKEYVDAARNFIKIAPEGALSKKLKNGDTVFYDEATNVFVVSDSLGVPRTMYKPNRGKAHFLDQE
jgi:hypothetical protein